MTIPLTTTRYSLTRPGMPVDRIIFRDYRAGHPIGDDADARPLLVRDLSAFLRGKLVP